MKTCAIAVLVVVLTAGTGFAEGTEFEKVTSEAGRFKVEMRGNRTQQTDVMKKSQTKVHRLFSSPSKLVTYSVQYFDLPSELVNLKPAPELLDVYLIGYNTHNEILSDKKITLANSQAPGREQFKKPKDPNKNYQTRSRVYLVGTRVYIVETVVIIPGSEALTNADAGRFFNSFAISEVRSR